MRKMLTSLVAIVAIHSALIGAAGSAQARATALSGYEPGTIVVSTSERRLYLVLGNGQVRSYPVGVGKAGKTWTGVTYINGKFLRPAWSPPSEIKMEKPGTPD